MKYPVLAVAALASLLAACGSETPSASSASIQASEVNSAVVPVQACQPNDKPETGVQGQVPRIDRDSGRSTEGYSCNLSLVGQFQGEGATWVSQSTRNCAYMATSFSGIPTKKMQGVQVIDVSNPANPQFVKSLDTPAFAIGTWESLTVNNARNLLAGVAVGPLQSAGFFDIYDISQDCADPVLLNGLGGGLTIPANLIGHEGNFSPDGRTYWATGANISTITAIDVEDPTAPKLLSVGTSALPNHGFSFSPDGNTMYLTLAAPAGVMVMDVSSIQNREAVPLAVPVGMLTWNDGDISQHTIPVNYNGKQCLIVVDEFGTGAVRFLDMTNPAQPAIASILRLEIQQPEKVALRQQDLTDNGLFGYEAHYCEVDRADNPTALACGFFQSGVRVFDIRDPLNAKEIAYFNPPAQAGKASLLPGSEHANQPGQGPSLSDLRHGGVGLPPSPTLDNVMNTDWCSSPPRFVGDQLWVTCQDNGFMVLQFAPGVYPFAE